MAKTGRPKKPIDEEQLKKLCAMQCTLVEIAGFFDCCEDTIENWCKREMKQSFSEFYKSASATGKVSLRRTQWKLAEKSTAMAIFLGKQYLGQTDKIETEITTMDDSAAQEIEVMLNAASDEITST